MSATASAAEAYAQLAPAYDVLTQDYDHEAWLAGLERLAKAHGLTGYRVLDVACGTGKSFAPLLARGYEISACDLSAEMLAQANARAPGVELFQADMRRLGQVGRFDLITCLDDAVNYLLSEDDLRATLMGFRENLAAGGVAVWDTNTLAMYRTAFASTWVVERDGFFLVWEGRASEDVEPGATVEAVVHVFGDAGTELWERRHSVHAQRHWLPSEVTQLAAEAGLAVVAVSGQSTGARLESRLDESIHTKAVYVARRAEEVFA